MIEIWGSSKIGAGAQWKGDGGSGRERRQLEVGVSRSGSGHMRSQSL